MSMAGRICAGCLLACAAFPTGALEQETHKEISRAAMENSVLNLPEFRLLEAMGLGSSVGDDSQRNLLPVDFLGAMRTPLELVAQGAHNEDRPFRMLNHFYDPQQGGRPFQGGAFGAVASPDWALAQRGTIEGQQNSYEDAKHFLAQGLTNPVWQSRRIFLSLHFMTLGHVIHHMQDMSQPQHVRDDGHCKARVLCRSVGLEYAPSGYEKFIGDWDAQELRSYLGTYGPVSPLDFATPRDFWEGDEPDGTGIAEFTSVNFISAGTNFRGDPAAPRTDELHKFPAAPVAGTYDLVDVTHPDLLGPVGPTQPLSGHILFAPTFVADSYAPDMSDVNDFATTYSLFADDMEGLGDSELPLFSVNRLTYRSAARFLLPRAEAYSTGLIDYLHRGRLAVEAPTDGVFGLLDHSQSGQSGNGFSSLRLTLRNETPNEAMVDGEFVAIAAYDINHCYRPDLLGEWDARASGNHQTFLPDCSEQDYLGPNPTEMVTSSAPFVGVTLTEGEAVELAFDFSANPIPVNAYNMRLRVLYRGRLGKEENAIAVGGRDISEPTWFSVTNITDFYAVDGVFYRPGEIRSDPDLLQRVGTSNIDPETVTGVEIVVGTRIVAGPSTLEPTQYHRVALLLDTDGTLPIRVTGQIPSRDPFDLLSELGPIVNTPPTRYTKLTLERGVPSYVNITIGKRTGGFPPEEAYSMLPPLDPGCTLESACAPPPTPIPISFGPD